MKNKVVQLCGMAVLVTLIAASVGQAAGSAYIRSDVKLRSVGGATILGYPLLSDPCAVVAGGTVFPPTATVYPDSDFSAVDSDTGAFASGPGLNAQASGTTWLYEVDSMAYAAPSAGFVEASHGFARQSIVISTPVGGQSEWYTFSADYSIEGLLGTDCCGDSAYSSVLVSMSLWESICNCDPDPLVIDERYVEDCAKNGDSDLCDLSGTLSFDIQLMADRTYRLELKAESKAVASSSCSTIPAPGAILLTGLGSGLVGWLRRRRMV